MSRRAVATLAGRLPQVSAAAQAALGGVRQASSTAHPAVEPDVLAHLSDTGLLRTQCYVGGQWIDASDGATLEVRETGTTPARNSTAA